MRKLILATLIILSACNQPPVHKYKYTVWLGTVVFSTGHDTDSITTTAETISFYEDSIKVTVYKSKVAKIEQNF